MLKRMVDSFRLIKEQCLTQLTPGDEVRVIIRATEPQLRKLPWHLWYLFESYPDAEVAFSSLSSQRFKRSDGFAGSVPHSAEQSAPNLRFGEKVFWKKTFWAHTSDRPNIRILIILGNSEGINVAVDEKLLKQYCQKAETVVLVEPTPAELNAHLWDDKGWDILFFSGHSRTESTKGRIFLNGTDSLTMDELRYGLQTAVMRGLQLAFFNSCDGLGIAAELESLHIPQVIVMREPVPDRVAHQFLKDFFKEFTTGKSLYQSVNIARKKLQGLEKDYPCASWLPVIVQNLLEMPPTWQSLGAISHCPYRGLAAFREEDAPYFYGREGVTQKLIAAVKQKHLVAVVGASGSGKSSVVFAGLVPQLKRDKKHDWLIVSFRPGNNPSESLAIATASADKTVKLWNLEGKVLKTLQGHSDEVLSVDISPDGTILASASKDKTVKLWNVAGQLLHTFEGHTDEVLDVRFSPDGKAIASASADDSVKVWSVEKKKELYTFKGHGGKASEVSFSPDGKAIATASANRTVKLWHLEGILPTFSGNSVSISPDSKTIAVSNQQGIVTPIGVNFSQLKLPFSRVRSRSVSEGLLNLSRPCQNPAHQQELFAYTCGTALRYTVDYLRFCAVASSTASALFGCWVVVA